MVLIERSGDININEQARDKLKAYWPEYYENNLRRFIPEWAQELLEGELPLVGVKVLKADSSRTSAPRAREPRRKSSRRGT
jgi:hypothetical protein